MFLLARLAKGNVSFCHHLASAVPEMDGCQMQLISYSGDQKLLQIRQSLAQQKKFGRLPKRPLKIVVLPKPRHKLKLQRQITLLFQSKTVCYEHSDWSKYIFVANEYTANVIYCSPQLFIFIEPINTRFHVHVIHKYSLNIRKETCFFLFLYDLIIKIVNFHGRSGKL